MGIISVFPAAPRACNPHSSARQKPQPKTKQAAVKGPWTEEEDNRVKALVASMGTKRWSQIAAELPGRLGKQCRERYVSREPRGRRC